LNKTITIIGAGASGLFVSILLAKKNYNITIIEKNPKAGRKILASGNGKCNITNQNLSLDNFHSTHQSFFKYAINNMPYEKIKNYFSSFGLEITKGDGTKVYPMSMQSSSVRDVLYNEALSLGVKFEFEQEVLSTIKRKNIFEVNTTNQSYKSTYLIVSTGSTAMKKLGSSSSGYSFAKSFGHKIIPTYPSLVQLKSDDKSIYNLSGVKIKSNIQLYINNMFIQKEYADILFTKYGVSGNGILTLSRASSKAILDKQKVYLMVDILPNISQNDIYELLTTRKHLLKNKKINFLLESIINTKMINFIYNKANIKVDTIYKLTTKDIDNIVYILKNIKIPISSTNGEQNAEICAGGVDVDTINDKTMMSKKIPNLYFCGEVLDVDGSCGGYNFHWAWSSASVCANSFKSYKL
jgi:predicted Rossmann fold flavoprotein